MKRKCVICLVDITNHYAKAMTCSKCCAVIFNRQRALAYRHQHIELAREKDRLRGKTAKRRIDAKRNYRKRNPLKISVCHCGVRFTKARNKEHCSKKCSGVKYKIYRRNWNVENRERTRPRRIENHKRWKERRAATIAALEELNIVKIDTLLRKRKAKRHSKNKNFKIRNGYGCYTSNCSVCNTEFKTPNWRQRTCSKKCSEENVRQKFRNWYHSDKGAVNRKKSKKRKRKRIKEKYTVTTLVIKAARELGLIKKGETRL